MWCLKLHTVLRMRSHQLCYLSRPHCKASLPLMASTAPPSFLSSIHLHSILSSYTFKPYILNHLMVAVTRPYPKSLLWRGTNLLQIKYLLVLHRCWVVVHHRNNLCTYGHPFGRTFHKSVFWGCDCKKQNIMVNIGWWEFCLARSKMLTNVSSRYEIECFFLLLSSSSQKLLQGQSKDLRNHAPATETE